MAYDFKKEQKSLYHPTTKPSVVDVPERERDHHLINGGRRE
jgi:hypothetical protein